MRRRKTWLCMLPERLLIAAIALLCSCCADDHPSDGLPGSNDELTGQLIHFGTLTLTDASADTRTATDLTTEGTTMTVLMTVGSSNPSSTKMADYKYTGSSWQAIDASGTADSSAGLRWQNSTTQHNFTAYSPKLTADEKANAKPTITLPTSYNSSNKSTYEAYLMTQTPAAVTPSSTATIALAFTHSLARIEVTTAQSVTTVQVIGAKASDAAGSTTQNITLQKSDNADGTTATHTGYLLPGETFGTEANHLAISIDGLSYSPATTVTTAAGKVTKFTIQ